MNKPGFTVEQHVAAGQTLRSICNELQTLLLEASSVFPQNSKTVRGLDRMLKGVNHLRSEMENEMFNDSISPLRQLKPDEASTSIYYGTHNE